MRAAGTKDRDREMQVDRHVRLAASSSQSCRYSSARSKKRTDSTFTRAPRSNQRRAYLPLFASGARAAGPPASPHAPRSVAIQLLDSVNHARVMVSRRWCAAPHTPPRSSARWNRWWFQTGSRTRPPAGAQIAAVSGARRSATGPWWTGRSPAACSTSFTGPASDQSAPTAGAHRLRQVESSIARGRSGCAPQHAFLSRARQDLFQERIAPVRATSTCSSASTPLQPLRQ